ncbi:MAG TPA: sigma-70 family RNA polymerase sigma factor [Tepidisphaeraceae bacterium]|jgi:RNA polymerase sigma factor (sigma-70 family)
MSRSTALGSDDASIQSEDDASLLRLFSQTRNDRAFNLLVSRHIHRVHSIARRHAYSDDLAEEITQAVFILLATKARALPGDVVVAGWLHRAAYLTARHAVRSRNRRRKYERRAAEMKSESAPVAEELATPSAELLAAVDMALSQLNRRDRDALLLRYLEARPLAEVGRSMGISEEAATKRVQRALVKMRRVLARRHINVAEEAIPRALISPPGEAPAALLALTTHAALAAAHGTLIGGSAIALAKGASFAVMGLRTKMIAACVAGSVLIGSAIVIGIWLHSRNTPALIESSIAPQRLEAPVPIAPAEGPRAPDQLDYKALAVNDPSLARFPYAPGWPRVLPGGVFSSPVLADLEGNGKPDIVVTCGPSNSHPGSSSHPAPNALPLLFALRPDGTTLEGWPVVIGSERQARPPHTSPWVSSPSVFRSRNGKDGVVIRGPGGAPIFIVSGNRAVIKVTSGNPAVSVPLADFNGDGTIDFAVGKALSTVEGGQVAGWPTSRRFRSGFGPCVGDALGDGHLKFYQLFYNIKGTDLQTIVGYDAHGNTLPGWPREVGDMWEPPVMGDVTGDGKMAVICLGGGRLFGWTWDGKPLAHTTSEGDMTGILKTDVMQITASPALADLGGDGKAEIIVYDENTHAIRAWHGDGRGVSNERSAVTQSDAADGVIAEISGDAHGVSVVSLGDDPRVMDFFAGSWWVRRNAYGKITRTNMIPTVAATEWTQPTVADVEGNGKADVIFGTSDGRLFVYQTGLAYHPERMQWPTAHGNFQHTGVWKR